MNEDPVISRGVLKAAAILLVGAGIGGGAYALASGGIDLPDIDLETTGDVTSLEDTTLEDTTIGGNEPDAPVKPEAPVKPDGGPKTTPFPDTLPEVQKLNSCIERAGSSTDEILACLEKYQ